MTYARSPRMMERRTRRRTGAGGFTLLELVIAMAASAMLLVGLSSALFLTMQATEPDLGGHESTLRGGEALVDLTGELRFAKTFLERTDKAVEFTVADRTGDLSDETIRWEWSGVAGDPLTRQYNGGTAVNILENVHDFGLTYGIDSVTTTQSGTGEVTSAETMFASFEGWDGITSYTLSFSVGTAKWFGEYVEVQGLPQALTSMSVTRVSLRLKQNAGGNLQVAIHKAIGGGSVEPDTSPIGSPVSVDVSTLPTAYEWVDVSFSDVTLDSYHDEFVILVKGTIDNAAYVEYLYATSAPSDAHAEVNTTNSGATWYPSASQRDRYDGQFRLYGTYTTSSETETSTTRYFVASSQAAVQIGPSAENRLETATQVLNRPEVSQP